MGAQLSLKAVLPLAERIATASDRCSETGGDLSPSRPHTIKFNNDYVKTKYNLNTIVCADDIFKYIFYVLKCLYLDRKFSLVTSRDLVLNKRQTINLDWRRPSSHANISVTVPQRVNDAQDLSGSSSLKPTPPTCQNSIRSQLGRILTLGLH